MAGVFLGSIYARLELETGKFSSAIGNAQKEMGGMTGASKKVATAFAPIGAAAGAAFTYAGVQAMNFETQMSNISTVINGDATQAIATMSDGILELSRNMPKSAEDLGSSAYDIFSAGITDTSQALSVLDSSARLATTGLSTTEEATDIMTSAINAFGLDANDSAKIADTLFKTVNYGKTTVAEMSQAFGASAPIIAAAGVSLEEFSAATAALTTTGMPAAQAQNSLRQAVVSLSKPTADMAELLKAAGYESGQAALEQDGLVKVMQKVDKAANGSAEKLGKAWGSVEGLSAATSLVGPVADTFTSTLYEMEGGANAINDAFEKQKATTASSLQLLKNEVNAAAIQVGSHLLPYVVKFAQFLTEKVGPAIVATTKFLLDHKEILVFIGAFITAAIIPAMYAFGKAAIINGAKMMIALGPIPLIIGIIAALAYLIITNWDSISAFFVSLWGSVVQVFNGFVTWVSALFAPVIAGITTAWNAIVTFFSGLWAGVVGIFNGVVSFIQQWGLTIIAVIFWPFSLALGLIIANWSTITAFFTGVWNGITAVFSVVAEWFSGVFQAAWNGIVAIWDFVVAYYTGIWNGIVTIFSPVVSWFSDMFGLAWQGIVAIWNFAVSYYTGVWNGIVAVFSVVAGWFGGIFSDAWNRITGVFAAVGGFFRGVWDTIVGIFGSIGTAVGDAIGSAFKSVVNGIISGAVSIINGFIDTINGAIGIINNIPGVSIPEIGRLGVPALASGGIATKATLAMIGEGSESEAILPLSKLGKLMRSELPNGRTGLGIGSDVSGLEGETTASGDTFYIDRVELPNVQNPDDFGREFKLKFASMRGV
jgi:TP901 family phage tail tape measure protein